MKWMLVSLAEMWRWRWKMGLPLVLGLVWGALHVTVFKEPYEARVLLQLQSEQAREPLLQKITARGHKEALLQKLVNPDVLADSGRELGVEIKPQDVKLLIFNDHFLGISYYSMNRAHIEQVVDNLAFNFIQQVLAPERARIERLLEGDKETLGQVMKDIEAAKGMGGEGVPNVPAANLQELMLKQSQLENEMVQLQTSLRLVNTAFDQGGSEALLWFAQPAVLVQQAPLPVRMALWMLWGGALGLIAGWLVFKMPEKWKHTIENAHDVRDACGLPVVGQLPWLGKVRMEDDGASVWVNGKSMRPSAYGEIGRLQASLCRGLRGPLTIVGVHGHEGGSLLALLLAEKSANLGKETLLADLNLKNRGLSKVVTPHDDADWSLPRKKGTGWIAPRKVKAEEHLKVLPAPRKDETLQELGQPGGVNKLMDTLSDQAEMVIVDATPVGATNRGNLDAVAVASASSRVVIVALAGVTLPGELRQAADTLLLAGAPVQGILLNMQQRPSRKQLLGELADWLGPLSGPMRRWVANAKVDS